MRDSWACPTNACYTARNLGIELNNYGKRSSSRKEVTQRMTKVRETIMKIIDELERHEGIRSLFLAKRVTLIEKRLAIRERREDYVVAMGKV